MQEYFLMALSQPRSDVKIDDLHGMGMGTHSAIQRDNTQDSVLLSRLGSGDWGAGDDVPSTPFAKSPQHAAMQQEHVQGGPEGEQGKRQRITMFRGGSINSAFRGRSTLSFINRIVRASPPAWWP